jgi:hypothetical protein
MLLIAAVSLWCLAGSLLWRVKGRVSIAIARVQSEFIESISEASHRGSAGFAAVRRGWACGILGCIRQDGGAPGQGGYAAANGMTWRPLAGSRIDPRLPSWGGVSPGRHRATLEWHELDARLAVRRDGQHWWRDGQVLSERKRPPLVSLLWHVVGVTVSLRGSAVEG